MNKFIDKFKRDNGFKLKVIGLVIIAILIFNANKDKKEATSQATCDTHNINGYLKPIGSEVTYCESDGCAVQYNTNPNDWPIIGDIVEFTQWIISRLGFNADFASCKSLAQTGKWVRASDENSASLMCESGKATLAKNNWFTKDIYICSYIPPEEQCSGNAFEKSLAKLLWPKYIDNCKTAYMIILIGGGAFLLVLILSSI